MSERTYADYGAIEFSKLPADKQEALLWAASEKAAEEALSMRYAEEYVSESDIEYWAQIYALEERSADLAARAKQIYLSAE